MLTLYGFGESLGLLDASHFVLKVHAYCTLNGIPFEFNGNVDNLRKAPKGKLPYIEDDGQIIPDSFFIIEYLKEKHGDSLDANLSDDQKALSHLVTTALDEGLYWALIHSRWVDDAAWELVKVDFFGGMPFPLKVIVPIVARKDVRKSLRAQGYGRHSEPELTQIANKSLQSLSDLLGDKAFFFGDDIHSLDVNVYAMLAQLILVTLDTPLGSMAKRHDNLVSYTQRVHERIYGKTV